MKRISLYTAIIGLALTGSLSSCLKDNLQPDFTQNKPVIELPIGSSATNGGGNSLTTSFTLNPAVPSDYFVYLNYAAPTAPSKDVTVTISTDTAAVTKFNTANGTNYTAIPSSGYTLAANKVVIPAGQKLVKIPFKINTFNLDINKTYALPVTIVDGGGFTVSGNFGTLITILTLRNRWDGIYKVDGNMIDHVNSSLTGAYPLTLQLITRGANTVVISDPNVNGGSFAHGILNNGARSSYGSFSPVFTIDPATNVITSVANNYGQPSPDNGRSARLDVTGNNKFTMSADGNTPVSMNVKYVMVQNGADRTFFDETWTFTSAR